MVKRKQIIWSGPPEGSKAFHYLVGWLNHTTMDQLLFLRGSPWSHRIACVMKVLKSSDVQKIENTPMLTFYARYKLSDWESKITLPILIQADGSEKLRESLDIAVYLNQNRNSTALDLFEKMDQVKKWNEKADLLHSHGRFHLNEYENTADNMLPPIVTMIPFFTKSVGFIMKSYFNGKYPEGGDISVEQLDEVLQEMNDILNQNDYLVNNRFSYADIAMSIALEWMQTNYDKRPILMFSGFAPKLQSKFYKKLLDKYPSLVSYKERIYNDHFAFDDGDLRAMQLKAKL